MSCYGSSPYCLQQFSLPVPRVAARPPRENRQTLLPAEGDRRVETEDLRDRVRSSSGTDGVKLVILFGHSDFVGNVLSPFECEYGLDRGRKRNRPKGRPTRSIEAGETRACRHPLRPCLPSCPHEKKRVKRVSLGGLGDRNKAN